MDTDSSVTCPICWEDYNKSAKKKVSCIYCGKSTCKKCTEENLLQMLSEQYSQPKCSNPNCEKLWNNDFLRTNLTQKFYKKLEKLREENAFISDEINIFPPFQDYAKRYSKKKEKYGGFSQINDEIKRIDHILSPLQSRRAKLIQVHGEMKCLRDGKEPYSFESQGSQSKDKNKDTSGIKVCPKEGCRGYLNKNYVCGMCGVETCRKCYCIKGESHRCDPNHIKTVDEIKKISKACPTCGVFIEKTIGCSDMWCQSEDTKIWMWSGEKKYAKDIKENDVIIGDDGLPRTIDVITSGTAEMYEVVQRYGDNYKVIGNHLLSLSNKGKIIDISVNEYLKLQEYKRKRGYYRATCKVIQWPKREVIIDPYILGLWLGDGKSEGSGFVSNDYEITQEWVNWAINNNADVIHNKNPYSFHIRGKDQGKIVPVGYGSMRTCHGCASQPSLCCATVEELAELEKRGEILHDQVIQITKWRESLPQRSNNLVLGKNRSSNPLQNLLKQYNLLNNKNIPLEYLQNDENTRLQLLAGIIDTDGNRHRKSYRVSQSVIRTKLCSDIVDVCHSLGLITSKKMYEPGTVTFPHGKTYKGTTQIKIRIMGNVNKIPVKLPRKKVIGKTLINSTIEVNPCGKGKYVGWSLKEGSPRYLLGDGTITHNCTNCRKGWNWDTEEVMTGKIVNPEYFDWINKNIDHVTIREEGDTPCGGLPDYCVVRKSYGGDISTIYRKIAHINDRERHNWVSKVPNIDRYYVGYLIGETSRSDLIKKRIMVKNMEKRNRDVVAIMDTFLACCIDIFLYLVHKPSRAKGEKGMKDLEKLRLRTNIALRDLGNKYKLQTPTIEY